ncbi:MAG TPA: hypothetical protein VHZ74_22225 [Bryobacteraceae bacterium]|jgi:hypothetical protein|nr:hypothetical protein [Bryobacteraceae bacterium]
MNRRTITLIILAFSAFSTLLGMRALVAFDHTVGATGSTPEQWPASSAIKRAGGRPELLVFVHPFCSCTDATMAELAQLSARRNAGAPAPAITVLFFRPRHSGWAPNSLWKKAASLPGAQAVWDDDGREAKRFGARTSGYTLLYSSTGALLFGGGVTASRGHQGDNYGLDELSASLNSGRPGSAPTRVFGCALGNQDDAAGGNL